LVKDRQSGALVSVAARPRHSAESSIRLFNGMTRHPQGHRDPNHDSPAKVLMNCGVFSARAGKRQNGRFV
jgi:hypothetical protein